MLEAAQQAQQVGAGANDCGQPHIACGAEAGLLGCELGRNAGLSMVQVPKPFLVAFLLHQSLSSSGHLSHVDAGMLDLVVLACWKVPVRTGEFLNALFLAAVTG